MEKQNFMAQSQASPEVDKIFILKIKTLICFYQLWCPIENDSLNS